MSVSLLPLTLPLSFPTDTTVSRNWPELTRAMRSGDPEAFATFYESTFDVMYQEVRRIAQRDESTSLDLVQDAMLKAIRCIKPLPDESAVGRWARTVAKSVTYDWLRQQARRQTTLGLTDSAQIEELAWHDAARMAWLEEQLTALPTDLKRLFSWRYRLGWSLQQIADRMGLKTGAVDGRIRREIARLKTQAQQEFQE